jgi:uncharacterized membrane protein YgcG
MFIDDALRKFLEGFRLPGEAQQIDRILEKFSIKFHAACPGVFQHADVAYILAFSIIMLNTDLHSANIPKAKKMTLEQYLSSCRGINQGEDLEPAMLTSLFQRIFTNEIQMRADDLFESDVVTFMAPAKKGWLLKQGTGAFRGWKKHWFLLADSCLYYFITQSDNDPRCIIPLENCRVEPMAGGSSTLCITAAGSALGGGGGGGGGGGDGGGGGGGGGDGGGGGSGVVKSVKVLDNGKMEQGEHKSFLLKVPSGAREERDQWVASIRREIPNDRFYDILQRKKEEAAERVEEQVRRGRALQRLSPTALSNGSLERLSLTALSNGSL